MIAWIYSITFRNCEFYTDNTYSKNEGPLSIARNLLYFPNFFEYAANVQFDLSNNPSLYHDYTHNLFKSITLIDMMLVLKMETTINIFLKYLSIVIQWYAINKNNMNRAIKLNSLCFVILLDKTKIYWDNYASFPNFGYSRTEYAFKVGKYICLDNKQIKIYRKMLTNNRGILENKK